MNAPFFIGWAPGSARPIARFLILAVVLTLGGSVALALALGARVDDPGSGAWVGERDYTGVLIQHPYPVLITDPTAEHPTGHAVLLSGGGKVGVQDMAARHVGQRVRVTGGMVMRGDLGMLFVNEVTPAPGAAPAGTAPPPSGSAPPGSASPGSAPLGGAPMPRTESLGRWRVVGEICDGKCTAGAMRPGDGLAHKACASVCILGGVPPVLVTAGPVEGRTFMLMGDPTGRALPPSFRDHVGVRRQLEGTVIRIADLLIFQTDVAQATVPVRVRP